MEEWIQSDTGGLVFGIGTNLVKIIAFTHIGLILAALMPLVERKVSAWMQDRVGPNRVGYAGILQPIADSLKFFFKEDLTPRHTDRVLFILAPALTVMPSILVLAVIPFAPPLTLWGEQVQMVIADLDVGILFVFALSSLAVYGISFAGWASNSKYPLMGGIRSAAQMISYELCLGLSVVGVFMVTESLRLTDVVLAQQGAIWNWYIFSQPLGALIFIIAAFAETNRLPFDLPEAETELVAGYHTEYGSMKFAMFFAGEYMAMWVFACLVAVLFLGGWAIPFMPQSAFEALGNWGTLLGLVSFLVKTFLFMFLYVWVRWTIPRFRFDQLMQLGWKVLLPLGLLNIVLTGFFQIAFGGE